MATLGERYRAIIDKITNKYELMRDEQWTDYFYDNGYSVPSVPLEIQDERLREHLKALFVFEQKRITGRIGSEAEAEWKKWEDQNRWKTEVDEWEKSKKKPAPVAETVIVSIPRRIRRGHDRRIKRANKRIQERRRAREEKLARESVNWKIKMQHRRG